jgi:hypothetical protein
MPAGISRPVSGHLIMSAPIHPSLACSLSLLLHGPPTTSYVIDIILRQTASKMTLFELTRRASVDGDERGVCLDFTHFAVPSFRKVKAPCDSIN